MGIATSHIASMYDEAARLARTLHTASDDVAAGRPGAAGYTMDEVLERIDNLTAHARAELEDERLRARDRWPIV